jgi:hypothetical protein
MSQPLNNRDATFLSPLMPALLRTRDFPVPQSPWMPIVNAFSPSFLSCATISFGDSLVVEEVDRCFLVRDRHGYRPL